ncbi:endonuclease domain of the non-LTR retrotransposon LINE-1 [Elysia marginata]|uniref:Endonuclease domain of the non-LTR retrotransposon LINE-1 n=1 Tax=Elysia marginata TaxID=1093978 RepID=A0AAV4IUT7_9GAST|nr:endonuclease domain of the non-LTR retrotransposon LINE-1 [Elysia marginata]
MLQSLRPPPPVPQTLSPTLNEEPGKLKPRKRGKKGGVRARFRRRAFRPQLPAIVTGNVRSINNKIDELTSCTQYLSEYREAGDICITETWLSKTSTDSSIAIDGHGVYRCDRTVESGKSKGGGVHAYINNKRCNPNNIIVTNKVGTPDLELLSLNLRPHYLPREFPKVNLNIVYEPPQANA